MHVKSQYLGVSPRPDAEPVPGLLFVPTIGTDKENALDRIDRYLGPRQDGRIAPPFSNDNCQVLRNEHARLLSVFGGAPLTVMEIGVAENGNEPSSTAVFLNARRVPDDVYVGLDVNERPNLHFLGPVGPGVWTLKGNSFDQQGIRGWLAEHGVGTIHLLLIDGDHSVDAVINDWRYSDLVPSGGCVAFHDTNFHPGPIAVLEAIDPALWEVKRFLDDRTNDYGIAVAVRK